MSFIYKGITMKACYVILVLFLKSRIVCSDDYVYTVSSFHLVGGMSPNEGRVEVTVTETDDSGVLIRGVLSEEKSNDQRLTIVQANFVCKQLGYLEAASVHNGSVFGNGQLSKVFEYNDEGSVNLQCDRYSSESSEECSDELSAAGVICQNDATVEPTRATNNPQTRSPAKTDVTMVTGGMMTRTPRTGTGIDKMTDASTMVSVIVDMNARSGSKSLVVQVAVPVVGVLIVAVLAILLILYIVRTRRTRSETKEDFPPSLPKSTFSNNIYNMHNVPNNEGPSYYEVRPNVATESTNDLIDNVLYKPADNIRGDTNEYELAQDPPNDAPRYGLVDNVLYKPVESIEDRHSNNHEVRPRSAGDHVASENLRQLPIDSEYAYADDIESCRRPREGELIDNILYKPADSQVQSGLASRKYYEIKPGSVTGHHQEADRPSLGNGRRYYDIQPEPSHDSSASNNFEKYDPGFGYDTTELETSDDAGPRFVIKTESTSPMRREYSGADSNDGIASNGTSTSAADVKQKPFPRYAKVQK